MPSGGDVVLIRLTSCGEGSSEAYNEAKSQLLRLKESRALLHVCVDEIAVCGGMELAAMADYITVAPSAQLGSIGMMFHDKRHLQRAIATAAAAADSSLVQVDETAGQVFRGTAAVEQGLADWEAAADEHVLKMKRIMGPDAKILNLTVTRRYPMFYFLSKSSELYALTGSIYRWISGNLLQLISSQRTAAPTIAAQPLRQQQPVMALQRQATNVPILSAGMPEYVVALLPTWLRNAWSVVARGVWRWPRGGIHI